ncbi:hypothetical protein GCM10007161_18080 [Ignatzschineria indica]|uniref:Trimeric autotransporter adhesin YadA-like stalk domain-containing protein n=3 Tax=Ignatzschineria indica TaxID=472583 RepID=A0A2U2AID7_9GAMM|nr:hypothetical protein DC082_09600 [Ignatzschineria indica]GGZ86715.1 hypothetical protein GCM10007161_18080 [Ignatzschineria indica]
MNGSQLDKTNQDVAANRNDINLVSKSLNAVGNRVAITEEQITSISKSVENNAKDIAQNKQDITDVSGRVSKNETNITQNKQDIQSVMSGKAGLLVLGENSEILFNPDLAADRTQFNIGGVDSEGEVVTRKITGLTAGEIAQNSTDAINGAQLYTVNQQNSKALMGKKAQLNADGTLKDIDFAGAVGASSPVNSVYDGLSTLNSRIVSGKAGLVQLSEDGKKLVIDNVAGKTATIFDFANVDSEGKVTARTLTGIAVGDVSENSTDAVNGSQLNKTNKSVAENKDAIAKNRTDIDAHQKVNQEAISGLDGRVKTNADAIAQNKQDIETHQKANQEAISDLDGRVKTNTDAIAQNKQDITIVSDQVSKNEGNIAQNRTDIDQNRADIDAHQKANQEAFGKLDGRVTTNTNDIAKNSTAIQSVMSGKAGLLVLGENSEIVFNPDLAADRTQFNIGGVDSEGEVVTRKITGLTAGEIAQNSTDAINGAQLYTVNQQNSNALMGKKAQLNADGTLKEIDFADAVGASSPVNSVYDGLSTLNSRIVSGKAGLVQLSEDGKKLVIDNVAGKTATAFDFANIDSEGKVAPRTLTGVAAGDVSENSTDAVNGSQLNKTNKSVAENKDAIAQNKQDIETHQKANQEAFGKLDGRVTANTETIKTTNENLNNVTKRVTDNESSIESLGSRVTTNEAGITSLGKDIETNTGAIAKNQEDIKTVTEQTSKNTNDIAKNSTAIQSVLGGKAGLLVLGENSEILFNPELAADRTQFNIGGVDSEGEVVTRKITGLTAGEIAQNSTDVINGAQLYTVNQQNSKALMGENAQLNADGTLKEIDFAGAVGASSPINNVYDGLSTLNSRIVSGKAGLVQLSEDGKKLVIDNIAGKTATTFDFANIDSEGKVTARTLTGVAEGDVSENSTEAVNGSQLFQTNSNVLDNTRAIAKNRTDIEANQTAISGLDDRIVTNTKSIETTNENLKNVSDQVGVNEKAIAENKDAIDKNRTDIDAHQKANQEAFGKLDGRVTTNTNDIAKNSTAIQSVMGGKAGLLVLGENSEILFNPDLVADRTQFNIGGVDSEGEVVTRKITGLTAGEIAQNSTDAINGAQLYTVNQQNSKALMGENAQLNADGTLKEIDFAGAVGASSPVNSVYDGLSTLNSRIVSGKAGLVQLSEDGKKLVIDNVAGKTATAFDFANVDSEGKVTARTLTGVAEGDVSENSTEAVNGSQLFQTNSNVLDNTRAIAKNRTDIEANQEAIIGLDGRVTENTETIKTTNENLNNVTKRVTDNESSIESLGSRVTTNEAGIISLGKDIELNTKDIAQNKQDITNVTKRVSENEDHIAQNSEVIAKGLNFAADSGERNLQLGDKLSFIGGADSTQLSDNNIGININNQGEIEVKLAKNLHIDSVQAGNTQLNGSGLSILDGPSVTTNGIYAGNKVISGLSAGEKDDDAVNKAQLDRVAQQLNEGLNLGLNFAGDDGQSHNYKQGETVHLLGGAEVQTLTDSNIGVNVDDAGNIEIKLAKDLNLTADGSIAMGDTTLNQRGLMIDGGPAITQLGIDMAGQKISDLAEGSVHANSKDAINGSQLYESNRAISLALMGEGDQGRLNPDGRLEKLDFSSAFTGVEEGTITSVYQGFDHLDKRMDSFNRSGGIFILGGSGQGKPNEIVINNEVASGRDTLNLAQDNGDTRKVTGVTAGDLSETSTDAVSGSQLNQTNQAVEINSNEIAQNRDDIKDLTGRVDQNSTNIGNIADALGGGASIDSDGKWTAPNFKDALQADTDINTVEDGFKHVTDRIDTINNSVGDISGKVESITKGESGVIQVHGDEIVIDDKLAHGGDFNIAKENGAGENRKLTGLAEGNIAPSSNEAVNGGQLYDANTAIANLLGGGAMVDSSGYVKYNTNGNNFTVGGKGYNSVAEAIQAIDQNQMFGTGEAVIYDKEGNKSTVGAITITGDQQASAINFAKADGAGRKVTGVADGYIGAGSTEAVNGGQIYEMNQSITQANQQIQNINYTLNHYNTRMNHIEKKVHENRKVASAGIASAMAMSSIPYIDYSKYSFGMGVGYYDGESAMSMGIQGRINDRAKYRVQFSYDTQNKVGIGAGVAFEF